IAPLPPPRTDILNADQPRILVLAGRRSATLDPLAAKMGVSHKALVPVAGEAMVGRVLRIAAEPTVARLHSEGRLTAVEAEHHIVDSVVAASRTTGFPLILCTADNVLMSVEGFRSIADAGSRPGVDGVVMMAEKKDILAAHPDGQRRFYRFRGGAYSNCNLFWLSGPQAFKAIESFRYGGQFAKRKRDAVRALGLTSLFLYVSGLVTLEGMFRHFSRRFGVRIRALVAKDGRLAIDVDNERTHRVAEELLART
ncbi:MAG TPA: spore coat biosynthesis protein F, partial [Allosphingosinicella sp.]